MTIPLTAPEVHLFYRADADTAWGEDARTIQKWILDPGEGDRSITIAERRDRIRRELRSLIENAETEGWEGSASREAILAAMVRAQSFLEALPSSLPLPEMLLEQDGEIGLEWYRAPRLVFSVSIGPGDLIAYAGLFGSKKIHGIEGFVDALPRVIAESLDRLYRDTPA